MADGRPMASLLGVRGKPGSLISTYIKGQELILIVAPGDPAVIQEVILEDTDAVIVLASVSPSRGADYLSTWVRERGRGRHRRRGDRYVHGIFDPASP